MTRDNVYCRRKDHDVLRDDLEIGGLAPGARPAEPHRGMDRHPARVWVEVWVGVWVCWCVCVGGGMAAPGL